MTGHGANSAVESAAALADNLSAMMSSRNHLSAEDIDSVFSQTALLRTERVGWLVEESARFQRYLSYTNFVAQVLFFRLVPLLETRVVTDFFSKRMFSGYRSKALRNPNLNKKVAHSVPYVDELLAEAKSDSCLTRIAIVAYMALSYFALSRQDVPIDGKWPSPLARAMQPSTLILPDATSNSLLLVSYWLTAEVAIQMTLVIESCRPRNRLALFGVAYLHGLINGFCSITATCCLTFLLDNIGTDGPSCWWPSATISPLANSRAVLLAALPGIAMTCLLVLNNSFINALYHPCSLCWVLFPAQMFLWGRYFSKTTAKGLAEYNVEVRYDSVSCVLWLYTLIGVVTATAHIKGVFYMLRLSNVTGPEQHLSYSALIDLSTQSHSIFSRSIAISLGALLVWNFLSTLALSRTGIVNVNPVKLLGLMFLGSITIGPAATAMMCSFWREMNIDWRDRRVFHFLNVLVC